MDQVSWVKEIEKGQSLPVTIVFGNGQSVTAVLRRINNALGHVQFRYESRKQADLRDYLYEEFGTCPRLQNAVLRIVETSPRVFRFEAVSGSRGRQASLSLFKPHFHNLSENDTRKTAEFGELGRCLKSVHYQEGSSQKDYNSQIGTALREAGWQQETRILKSIGLRCDFVKNGVWLEVEFGNARTYYQDYIKFLLAHRYREARFGVLLCPTSAFAQLLCDLGQKRAAMKSPHAAGNRPVYGGMMSYEKAIRELPFLGFLLTGGIIVVGIEIQS